jgi:hypothetical protein
MKPKRTWAEKLNSSKPHAVKPAPIDIAGMKAGQIMLVPSARIVDAFIRTIPKGASMDVPTLRKQLARKFKAEVTCPITTGFHLKTVAEAAFEALDNGARLREVAPIWRVLDEHSPTTNRLSCGPAFITRQRAREGLSARLPARRRIG